MNRLFACIACAWRNSEFHSTASCGHFQDRLRDRRDRLFPEMFFHSIHPVYNRRYRKILVDQKKPSVRTYMCNTDSSLFKVARKRSSLSFKASSTRLRSVTSRKLQTVRRFLLQFAAVENTVQKPFRLRIPLHRSFPLQDVCIIP